MHREKPHKLLQVGVTPTPATSLVDSSWSGVDIEKAVAASSATLNYQLSTIN